MKEIKLTQGQVAIVDDEDFERLNKFKWYVKWDGYTGAGFAERNISWPDGSHSTISMHREIFYLKPGSNRPFILHSNGNKFDNRKVNLKRRYRNKLKTKGN